MKQLLLVTILILSSCFQSEEYDPSKNLPKKVIATCRVEARNNCIEALESTCQPYEIIKEEAVQYPTLTFKSYVIEAVCK